MKAEVSAVAREWLEARDSVAELIDTPPGSDRAAKELVDRATRILAAAAFVGAAPKGSTGRWLSGVAEGPMKLVSAAGEVLLMASASDPDGEWTDDFPGPQVSEVLELLDERSQEMEDRLAPDLDKLERGEQDPLRKKIARSLNPEETPPKEELEPAEKAIRDVWLGLEYEKAVPAESWEVAREGWERFFVDNVEDLLASAGERPERILAAIAALLAYARGNVAGFGEALEQLLAGQTVDESDDEGEAEGDDGSAPGGNTPPGTEELADDLAKLGNFLETAEARDAEKFVRRKLPLTVFITIRQGDRGNTLDPESAALWYAKALHDDLGLAAAPKLLGTAAEVRESILKPLTEGGDPGGSFVLSLTDLADALSIGDLIARISNAKAIEGEAEGKQTPVKPGDSPEGPASLEEFARALWECRGDLNLTVFDRDGIVDDLLAEERTLGILTRGMLRLRRLDEDQVASMVADAFSDADYDPAEPALIEEVARSLVKAPPQGDLGLDLRIQAIVDRVALEHGNRVGDAVDGSSGGGGNSLTQLREVQVGDLSEAIRVTDPERVEAALEKLNQLIGLPGAKNAIKRITNVVEANRRARSLGLAEAEPNLNFVFLGPPGTGKTTVAQLMGDLLGGLGVSSTGRVVKKSATDLMGEYVGSAGQRMSQAVEEALGGILLIDDAYALAGKGFSSGTSPYGAEALDTLVDLMETWRESLVVIMAGYEHDMDRVWEMNAGLRNRFPEQFFIPFDPFTTDELLEILSESLRSLDREFDEAFMEAAEKQLRDERDTPDFAGARSVRNLVDRILTNHSTRVAMNPPSDEDFPKLVPEDLERVKPHSEPARLPTAGNSGSGEGPEVNGNREAGSREPSVDVLHRRYLEAREELDALIGLEPVKEQLEDIANRVFYNQRMEEIGRKTGEESAATQSGHHMIFTGPPGTGKTTVAKILGRMFAAMGILRDGHVKVTTSSDFVGDVMGSSRKQTREVFRNSKGQVLFIDEVYGFAGGARSLRGGSYEEEAVTEINFLLEEMRHELVVVVAGYEGPVNEFLAMNEGLKDRFSHEVKFPDYSVEELCGISLLVASENGLVVSADAEKALESLLGELRTGDGFANGRTVRELVARCETEIANRSQDLVRDADEDELEAQKESLYTIQPEDVAAVREKMIGRRMPDGDALRDMFEQTEGELTDLGLPKSVKRKLVHLVKRAARAVAGDELEDPAFDLIFVGDDHEADRALATARVLAGFLEATGLLSSSEVTEFHGRQFAAPDPEIVRSRISERIRESAGASLLIHDAHLLPAPALAEITNSLSEKDRISIYLRVPDQKSLNSLREQDPDLEAGMEEKPLPLGGPAEGTGREDKSEPTVDE